MVTALLLALGLAAVPAEARKSQPDLEGTAWKVMIDRKTLPEGLWSSDLLVFGQGRMVAVEYLNWGFAPSDYEERIHNGRVHWKSSLTTRDGRMVHWLGIREGRRMTGKLMLVGPGGAPLEVPWRAVIRPVPRTMPPGF